MTFSLLAGIVIIIVLAMVMLYLCLRLHIPTIVGLLFTGILAGPYLLGVISYSHEVEVIAEVGVVLLLFTIGLEFSLKSLLKIGRTVMVGGGLQVLITIGAVYLAVTWLGFGYGEAVFAGFLISLSSTAIVLKVYQDRAAMDTQQGQTVLAVLIFQDVIVVPMMLLVPFLAGQEGGAGRSLLLLSAKAVVIIVVVIISARWLVPAALHRIARTKSRELFLLGVVAICITVAFLTYRAGLSLALGAFLAGLIISESEYSHQALGNILPFRDLFTGFFFISIGMLLDIGYFAANTVKILTISGSVVLTKAIIAVFSAVLLGLPLRTAVIAGFSLAQIGEFSFVLSKAGLSHNLFSGDRYQLFLSVSILTMLATPFIISVSPWLAGAITRLPFPQSLKAGLFNLSGIAAPDSHEKKKEHIIVVGYGVNGKNVARAASIAGIPYLIIEMNPDTVRREQERGEHIIFGSADQEAVLDYAGIAVARVLVIAIADPAATRQVTAVARKNNPDIYIIARTRYIQEVQPLYELGADEVIPEEFETSVEIFTRVLKKYLVPLDEIRRFVQDIRSGGYEMLRGMRDSTRSCGDLSCYLAGEEVAALRVSADSMLAGKSLAEIKMRKDYEVAVVAVRRGAAVISNPDGDTRIFAGDVLITLGTPDRVATIATLLNPEGWR